MTSVLAVLVAAGWLLLGGGQEAAQSSVTPRPRAAATPVLVETLKFTDENVVIRAVGTGEALKAASIYPSVSGEVTEVTFKAGQRVTKGMVLVRLDDKHQKLAMRLAEVAVKDTRRQLKRIEKLAPSGAASVARLETAQVEYESAVLRLDQAMQELRDRTVYAPFDGIIGLTEIERGDRITAQTLIATLDDRSVILVDFSLPEEIAGKAQIGGKVAVEAWASRDRKTEGTISELGSRIDPVTRSLRVKARIENANLKLRPGTSFEVTVAFTGRAYPNINEVAVLWSRDGAYIWRVGPDSKADKVFVKIVRRDKGRILVDGPLAEGDAIVVEGVQGLRNGQLLKAAPYTRNTGTAKRPAGTKS